MKFGEFITKIKTEPNAFWCLTSVTTKMYQTDSIQVLSVNKNTPYAKLKELILETKDMFSGGFYCGSVSAFFEKESDINLLKIKYPEILN